MVVYKGIKITKLNLDAVGIPVYTYCYTYCFAFKDNKVSFTQTLME